jgi:hypothetical protein
MATAARLAGLLSVALAITLNLASSPQGGSGLIALVGWVSIGLLIVGLVIGHRGGVGALAVGFVMRLAMLGAMGAPTVPDLWVQTLLLVLSVEAASISFTLRVRPVDPLAALIRGLTTALMAAVIVEIMEELVAGTDTSGLLVRVAGIAALVIAAGWVIRTWRRSGLVG